MEISPEEVRRMASIGCNTLEIGQKFGKSQLYIEQNFKFDFMQGQAELREILHEGQLKCALEGKGDSKMLIFLGNIYLGQKESAANDKISDLDLLLKYINEKATCSNFPKNN